MDTEMTPRRPRLAVLCRRGLRVAALTALAASCCGPAQAAQPGPATGQGHHDDGAWRNGVVKPGRDVKPLSWTLTAVADDGGRPQATCAVAANIADAGMTLTEPRYRGEWGLTFDHNGSEMAVFPRAGLVAYVKPKASLAGTVRPGDVVYRGSLTPRMSGTAYLFKSGCAPAPYHVEGGWMRPGAIDFGFTLRGPSPVRDGGSCGVGSYSARSPNAVLRFESTLDSEG